MNTSMLSGLVAPLGEFLRNREEILEGYRERSGFPLARYRCDCFPWEFLDAMGMTPVREYGARDREGGEPRHGEGDILVVGGGPPARLDIIPPGGVRIINVPGGWGEEWAASFHAQVTALARSLPVPAEGPDPARLAAAASEYNDLRRAVRSIAALRVRAPRLLSNADLQTVFDAATMLPVKFVSGLVAGVLEGLKDAADAGEGAAPGLVPCLVSAARLGDASVLDEIEEAGFLVAEDSACDGRRQFDMSYNAGSELLYYEILDAFSYRPFCGSIRPPAERFELFYKLLRGHGIDTVLFLDCGECPDAGGDAEYLRVRLMRAGIDPVIVPSGRAAVCARDHLERSQRPSTFR